MFKIKNRAFTIIEVILVLAIAGLIFLMVFIALPALQRNQRDTQRRNDAARLKTAVDNYKANNRGRVPPLSDMNLANSSGPIKHRTESNFYNNYLLQGDDLNFLSPEGGEYYTSANYTGVVVGDGDGRWKPSEGRDNPWAFNGFHFGTGTRCDGEYKVVEGRA